MLNKSKSLKTGQYYDTRTVEGPQALEAAKDFSRLASEHDCVDLPVTGQDADATVHMQAWPPEKAFGSWFQDWVSRWDIEVED